MVPISQEGRTVSCSNRFRQSHPSKGNADHGGRICIARGDPHGSIRVQRPQQSLLRIRFDGGSIRSLLDRRFSPGRIKGIEYLEEPSRSSRMWYSSGGICAFTVAGERPDQFGKVMSHIGSLPIFEVAGPIPICSQDAKKIRNRSRSISRKGTRI